MLKKYIKKINKLLGKIKEKVNRKDFFTLLLIILIPNILRQIIYYATFLKTNSVGFIASYETVAIYNSFPFLGVVEEIIIGIVFAFFYFKYKNLKFFSYGWITDSLIDFISVISWFTLGLTPLQFLGLNQLSRFFVREILFSYIIFGPLLYKYNFNIRKLSFIYSIIGIMVLIFILI